MRVSGATSVVALALVASGCAFPEYHQGDAGAAQTAATTSASGASSGGSGGAGGDGIGGDAAGTVCGGGLLQDGFDDGMPGPLWQLQETAMQVTEMGTLSIQLTGMSGEYGEYISVDNYPFDACSMIVHVVSTPAATTDTKTYLRLEVDEANSISMRAEQGMLYFRVVMRGKAVHDTFVPHDPVEQAWWRLRQAGGVVYFETSPSGEAWTAHAAPTVPAIAPALRVVLGATTNGSGLSSTPAVFDDMNLPP